MSKKPKARLILSKVERSNGGLRDALFDAWDAFRGNKMDGADAVKEARIASVIINSARLDLMAQKQGAKQTKFLRLAAR